MKDMQLVVLFKNNTVIRDNMNAIQSECCYGHKKHFYKGHYIYTDLEGDGDLKPNTYYELEDGEGSNYPVGFTILPQGNQRFILEHLRDGSCYLELKKNVENGFCFLSPSGFRFFELTIKQTEKYYKSKEKMGDSFNAKQWFEANALELPIGMKLTIEDNKSRYCDYFLLCGDNYVEETCAETRNFYDGVLLETEHGDNTQGYHKLIDNKTKTSPKDVISIEVLWTNMLQ